MASRVYGSQQHMNAVVLGQERLHERCLVAADVVADDVNLAATGLAGDDVFEERDELLTGVTHSGLAQHFAGGGVQRRKQAQRAVALVFEAVALGTPGRQWQHSVLAVERLDRGLLIHAEHRCMGRRIQVQPDDIGSCGRRCERADFWPVSKC